MCSKTFETHFGPKLSLALLPKDFAFILFVLALRLYFIHVSIQNGTCLLHTGLLCTDCVLRISLGLSNSIKSKLQNWRLVVMMSLNVWSYLGRKEMGLSKILYFIYLSLSISWSFSRWSNANSLVLLYILIYPNILGNVIMVIIPIMCHHGTTLWVQALKKERAVAGWQQW